MNNSMKKPYMAPVCEAQGMECGAFMIEIGSGNTSPEESDTNSTSFQEEENEKLYHTHSLWDE